MVLERLAGDLKIYPGLARPLNLLSTRPAWVGILTQGKSASVLPGLLASVFSLCGHAHRLCAQLAVGAAQGQSAPLSDARSHTLQIETLREHLRRISLDWPQQLASGNESRDRLQTQALQALKACPFPMQGPVANRESVFVALQTWVEQEMLGMAAQQWLDGWDAAPKAWMVHWCTAASGWLPQLLQQGQAAADWPMVGAPALRVHDSKQGLAGIVARLGDTPTMSRQPLWLGRCAETGPWGRLNQTDPEAFNTPWLRLAARLAELVRLCLPDEAGRSGALWLQAGSLVAGECEGLAWVEMARGLLIHHVHLDSTAPDARVVCCHVVAPTEWNFHPLGAVALALENMPKTTTPEGLKRILALMTAYDPCVRFELAEHSEQVEPVHA